jgi:hypothetical protein
VGQTDAAALLVSAQSLLHAVQPTFGFDQGDVSMFIVDIPDVPPQYAPVVLAQSSQVQAAKGEFDRVIGVCQLVENPANLFMPPGELSGTNAIGPTGAVESYFVSAEGKTLKEESAESTVLKGPAHGRLQSLSENGSVLLYYVPNNGYLGKDSVTFQVLMDGMKVKVAYSLHVVENVQGSDDSVICPETYWRISGTVPDSGEIPAAGYLTASYPISSLSVNLNIASLPGGEVGEAQGNTNTIDPNADGYGWFIDSTPQSNEEFLPTSDPNEWIAKPGSVAAGKMDLLTVLLHEYGHVLGLDHGSDSHDFMAEELQPGVRRTVSDADMAKIWSLIGDQISSDPNNPFDPSPLGLSFIFGLARRRVGDDESEG